MDKKDIIEYALKNNGFDIFDVYARFVTENGTSVFTGYHDFCGMLEDICAHNSHTEEYDRIFGRVKYNSDRFLQRMHEANSYIKHFYDYVLHKLGDKDKVWDVGSGAHPLTTVYLKEKGVDVVAIDPQVTPKFMDYFKCKYHKDIVQRLEPEFVIDNPDMIIGFRPCGGQEPMLDLAQKYGKKVITKSCDCRILTDSKEALVGEHDKTMYYLKKYPFLKLGSMLSSRPDFVSVDKVSMDTVMETD